MPIFVLQSSGNPLVRFLIGFATLAILAGRAFLMLPVVLCIIAAALVLGLAAWAWAWYHRQKYGDPTEELRRAMERAQEEARQRYGAGAASGADNMRSSTTTEYTTQTVRIETTDNKKWKMNDVEDIEEKK